MPSHSVLPAFIILLVLALLPVGRSSEAPLIIAAVAGIVMCWRQRDAVWSNSSVRLCVVIFACYWLAAFVSAPGAVAPGKTWSTVGYLLRFLPFAIFVSMSLRDAALSARVQAASAAIVLLWLLDAWVQILTGYSLAGAMASDRLSGIFGAGNLKLGPVLAVLSPFVFSAARRWLGWRGLALAFVFQLVPILLAGSRAAWLMYTLVVLVVLWRETRAPLRFAGWSAALLVVAMISAGVAVHVSGAFDSRVQRTLLVLHGNEQSVDAASAGRLRIWGTALRMSAAHPLTGVGVRGFRYAYPDFADPGDAFIDAKTDEGAYHAHQIVLEILGETGVTGLILWIFGGFWAIRAWYRASPLARARAATPGLALIAMTFPLNTHLAFYSAWWGLLFWWLLALYCAALSPPPEHASPLPQACLEKRAG
ncbi:MAG TPA: O-antigen ligase family protein [Rudaea sp.]|nr:O-antigen ligase family protein [Rudaea sp.]